ncbi:Hypothetical Protein FCC1311_034012 [Hondaea fermentalgiana]|uniref:Uncharacterized protein n=1 Tax=Hondaea fermentalgiana TaxID=2315210 RepID=A0A2R5GBU4_9STRA|nr:Hypothetical Protein FCC1311_034012 [Hondaea fermentalgiana]|eukprot:GBG27178.1 Hypothetical Protein FCC1311_034012 [Hondaea fermentalgiana]
MASAEDGRLPVPTVAPTAANSASNRDARAQEALRMKDEQIRMLTEQNTKLLKSLDKVEEEASQIQHEKLAVEEECRKLKDENFEVKSKNRAVEAALRKIEQEVGDRDQKIKIMTSQNSELLRLLETEESQTAALEKERNTLRVSLDALKDKYSSLLTTAKTHEELAGRAAREGQLRAEELRLLRSECEQLRVQNADMERKSAVEIESLQEQLRVRKEKQYHLLEKMQAADESKRQAEDQAAALTEKMRALHARTVELETQLQVETKAKRDQEEANRALSIEEENLRRSNADLQDKARLAEEERLRMEAEARDSGEQLREMAEKVFQLLERLKLAELGKSKSVEQLRKCEQELLAIKKKSSRLLKESTKEGKQRVKAELDKKVLLDQIRSLKTHNAQLAHRCREEVKFKLKEHEERKAAEEKVRTLGGRLSFLLNKLQADEEIKIQQREEIKKMEAQIKTLQERSDELLVKLNSTGESNRIVTQAMRLKQEEVEGLQLKYAALLKKVRSNTDNAVAGADGSGEDRAEDDDEGNAGNNGQGPMSAFGEGGDGTDEPSAKEVRASGGKGRFYLDPKPTQGMILVRAKRSAAKKMLERLDINGYLKRSQRSSKFKELVIEKLTHILGLLCIEEDEQRLTVRALEARKDQIDHLTRRVSTMQRRITDEEDAKRKTLLRYVQVVKTQMENGVLQLAESGIGDEEIHALAAVVRGSTNVFELNLRNNEVSDSGARALAALLAGPPACSLRNVDLRNNKLTDAGVRMLAEALERAQATRHVYVHAGGKIEALGTRPVGEVSGLGDAGADAPAGPALSQSLAASVAVHTVCVVDARGQKVAGSDDGEQALTEAAVTPRGDAELGSPIKIPSPRANDPDNVRVTPKKRGPTKRERKRAKEEQKLIKAEQGWRGRAAGFDIPVQPSTTLSPLAPNTQSESNLPPLTPPERSGATSRTRQQQQNSSSQQQQSKQQE